MPKVPGVVDKSGRGPMVNGSSRARYNGYRMQGDRYTDTSHFQARSAAWSIHTEDEGVRAMLDEVFGDLAAPPTSGGTHYDIRPSAEPGQLVLRRDGHETTQGAAQVIDHLVGFLNQQVLEGATDTLDLHASAMTDPASGFTVVATAPSGGGKTTLAAHLCRAGWSYLSDETVGIDLDDGSLVGCGKPLTVKDGLHATLGLDLGPLTIDSEVQRRWYVRPALLGGSIASTAPPPTDLVFINFAPTATDTEIREVPPHQALMRLISNTYRLDRHRARVLPTLARLVARARTWELSTGDGADGVQQLLAAATSLPLPDREVVYRTAPGESRATIGPAPVTGTTFAGFAASGAVVHDHIRSQAVVLDAIGSMVWQLLDGSTSIADVANELAQHFDAQTSTIAADVDALCRNLTARGFLTEPD